LESTEIIEDTTYIVENVITFDFVFPSHQGLVLPLGGSPHSIEVSCFPNNSTPSRSYPTQIMGIHSNPHGGALSQRVIPPLRFIISPLKEKGKEFNGRLVENFI